MKTRYALNPTVDGQQISHRYLWKFGWKFVKILFSVSYYLKSVGNINSKAVKSCSGMAPLPHRRQWMTPLHVCTPTRFQVICVMSSRLEVGLCWAWLIIRREATCEWRWTHSLHEHGTQKLVLRTVSQEMDCYFARGMSRVSTSWIRENNKREAAKRKLSFSDGTVGQMGQGVYWTDRRLNCHFWV